MIPLLLAGLCAALPLAFGQRGTNCVPTKAQVILREKMAELDAAKPSTSATPAPAAAQVEPAKPAPVAPVAVAPAPTSTPSQTTATPVSRTGLTPEQEAKARQALRQEMEALQPATTPPPAAVQTAPTAAPAPRPTPVPVVVAPAPQPTPAAAPVVVVPAAKPSATTPPPVVAATGLTPEQEAKARQALRQKMEVLGPVTPPPATVQTAPTPAPTTAPAPKPTPVPVVVAPAPQPAPVVAASPEVELPALTAEQAALARETLRRKMAELDAAMAAAQVEPVPAPVPAPVVPPVAVVPPPIAPVALPPSEKQGLERLAEITEQYRAGLMTPLAYHQERAMIIQSLR